ncbi:MAG: hypothetical protein LBM04_08925 [Opitutaceae bacterium]|nr:hypothetical protein [Opitutaceae bacterium]
MRRVTIARLIRRIVQPAALRAITRLLVDSLTGIHNPLHTKLTHQPIHEQPLQ